MTQISTCGEVRTENCPVLDKINVLSSWYSLTENFVSSYIEIQFQTTIMNNYSITEISSLTVDNDKKTNYIEEMNKVVCDKVNCVQTWKLVYENSDICDSNGVQPLQIIVKHLESPFQVTTLTGMLHYEGIKEETVERKCGIIESSKMIGEP
eukprot:UN33634